MVKITGQAFVEISFIVIVFFWRGKYFTRRKKTAFHSKAISNFKNDFLL